MSSLILLALIIWIIWLMLSRRKQAKLDPTSCNRALTRNEKIQIWIQCLFQPIWGGAILYYGWRTPLPTMAKEANRISFIAFGIEIILVVIGIVVFGFLLGGFAAQ